MASPIASGRSPAALLIIDMQNDFVIGNAHCKVEKAALSLPGMRQVLEFFRSQKLPVFHIIRSYEEDGSNAELFRQKDFQERRKYIVAGTKGAEIVEELQRRFQAKRFWSSRASAPFSQRSWPRDCGSRGSAMWWSSE